MFNCIQEDLPTLEDSSYIDEKKTLIVKILAIYFVLTIVNFILVAISASYMYTNHHTALFVGTIINGIIIVPYLIFVWKHIRIIRLSTILMNAHTLKLQFIRCIKYTNIKTIINFLLFLICFSILMVALHNNDLGDHLIISIYSYFLGLSPICFVVDRYICYQLSLMIGYIDKMHPNSTNDMLFLE